MRTHGDSPFEAILGDRSPAVASVALRLRELIASVHPGATEVVWQREGSAGYGFGPAKMSQHYAYLRPFAAHVGLGFFHGVDLDDPAGRLEGSGKRLRHVKVRTLDEADDPELRALLERAVEERRTALGASS